MCFFCCSIHFCAGRLLPGDDWEWGGPAAYLGLGSGCVGGESRASFAGSSHSVYH
jgi:hypothetical protein